MKAKVAPNCSEFNDFTAEANYSDKLRGKLAVGLIILLKGSTNTVGGVGVARKSKSKMITKMFTFTLNNLTKIKDGENMDAWKMDSLHNSTI